MEFLIDKKFWNKVMKKINVPSVVLEMKEELKHEKHVGTGIKIDFELEFFSKVAIAGGFFKEQCEADHAFVDISKKNQILVEKAMLEVLIETQGLSEKIQYSNNGKMEYIIEQYEPINSLEKGFVYFIRNEEIYKIGITDNLLRRFNQLKPDEVLNVVRCSNFESLEKELHKKFKEFRIPQTEYFRLSKNQIEQVNIEMTKGAEF